jgi:hypothetical protein
MHLAKVSASQTFAKSFRTLGLDNITALARIFPDAAEPQPKVEGEPPGEPKLLALSGSAGASPSGKIVAARDDPNR